MPDYDDFLKELPPLLERDTTPENWHARRQQLLQILQEQEYGLVPQLSATVTAKKLSEQRECAGLSVLTCWQLTVKTEYGEHSFPIYANVPCDKESCPFIILPNFHSLPAGKYLPMEEVAGRGYATISIHYEAISPDRENGFVDPMAAMLRAAARDAGVPEEALPARIAVWAWSVCRVLDWALTQPGLDGTKAAVLGHSRLGKTALLAGALDERFAAVLVNDSGCSGDALAKDKTGERIRDITKNFSHWSCGNYKQYIGKDEQLPFDQHWLVAACAPRLVCCGTAQLDDWADPDAQYRCCLAASPAWQLLGKQGLIHPRRMPLEGDIFGEGDICYHRRKGVHYLSRMDYQVYLDFLDNHGWSGENELK